MATTAVSHAVPSNQPPMTSVTQWAPRYALEKPTAAPTNTATAPAVTCWRHGRPSATNHATAPADATATVV